MAASRIVGILGGMGPAATVDFYDKLVRATPARVDQDHLRVVMWADPTVPDRHAAVRGTGEDPLPWLEQGVRRLQEAGADLVVAPCNTVHALLPDVVARAGVEFVSIIDTAVGVAVAADRGHSVGVVAADGAVEADLYQSALRAAGRRPVLPTNEQQAQVMSIIHRVKAGGSGEQEEGELSAILGELATAGATSVIVGCTELSVLLGGVTTDLYVVDAAEALAQRTVALCAVPGSAGKPA